MRSFISKKTWSSLLLATYQHQVRLLDHYCLMRCTSTCRLAHTTTTGNNAVHHKQQQEQQHHRSLVVHRYHPTDLRQSLQLMSHSQHSHQRPIIHRPTDVLVRVLASSINPLDLAMSRGYGQVALTLAQAATQFGIERLTYDRLPLTLGRDFVGKIVALGSEVANDTTKQSYLHRDALVWGTVPPWDNGAHADLVVVSSTDALYTAPRNLSPVDATTIPYVGLTAWSALFTFGMLQPNTLKHKRILILGGSGGVGCVAVQLLKHWGAHVTTTCSDRSMAWLAELVPSIDEMINYNDMETFFSHECAPESFDFILDASTADAAKRNIQLFRSLIGRTSSSNGGGGNIVKRRPTYVTLTSPLLSNFDQQGIIGGAFCTLTDVVGQTLDAWTHGFDYRWAYYMPNLIALKELTRLVEKGALKPFPGMVFPLEHAIDAYEHVQKQEQQQKQQESSSSCGKVVFDFTL